MNWHLVGSEAIGSSTSEIGSQRIIGSWIKKDRQDLKTKNWVMLFLGSLIQKSHAANLNNNEIMAEMLRHRMSGEIVLGSPCLNESQIFEIILKTGQHLNLTFDPFPWIYYDDDLPFGTELLTILRDCSSHTVESARMYFFFKQLIIQERLETVIASTMNSVAPKADKTVQEDLSSVNMWYNKLDDIFRFSLASALSPLSSTKQQRQLSTLKPPFWNDTHSVAEEECEEASCQLGEYVRK